MRRIAGLLGDVNRVAKPRHTPRRVISLLMYRRPRRRHSVLERLLRRALRYARRHASGNYFTDTTGVNFWRYCVRRAFRRNFCKIISSV